MNTLLYLLYGSVEEFHLELTYSVLSALARSAGGSREFRIVLASHENMHRNDLPVEHLPFSNEELHEWTFGGRFNHGAKIGALGKAAGVYGGKQALIDTDTYFLRDPSEIFDRIDDAHVVMYADEGPIRDHGQIASYRQLIQDYDGPYRFDEDSHMFNSGVVGVGDKQRALIGDAATLTRDLLELGEPLHTLEQFSFGVVFGSRFAIRTCDDVVRHYAGYERRFMHKRIKHLFPGFSREAFDAALVRQERIGGYPPTSKLHLVAGKLKGLQRRGLHNYGFAYRCHLNALSARSRADANAWAGTALDVILDNRYPREQVASDFAKLRDETTLASFDASVRDRWNDYWLTTTSPAVR